MPSWVADSAICFVTINARERGIDSLLHESRASALLTSAKHQHISGTWWLHLILIMPDHLHALLSLPHDRQLARVITAWKSYQTKSSGIGWQSGFFDHRLRSEESLQEKAHYIRMNPVRAELVASPEDWPHVWSPNE